MNTLLDTFTIRCGCGARHLRWSSMGLDWAARRRRYRAVFNALVRDDFDEAKRLTAVKP